MADAPKVIDPGNEFSGPKKGSLEWVISWVRKYPATTLPSGEGKMLLDEIDRLRALLPAQSEAPDEAIAIANELRTVTKGMEARLEARLEERMKETLREQDALRGNDPLTKALP